MLCLAALAFCRCDDKRVTVGDLTVEMLENPVGLDERTPRKAAEKEIGIERP